MRQIMMYVDYGRKLYDQIELPYGPLLFYGPVIVQALLSPLHASPKAAYYTTLVLEHVIGLLLVVYVLDRLPIMRKWRIVFLLLCLLHTYPFGLGLNYTFLRFVLPIAFLVLATRQRGHGLRQHASLRARWLAWQSRPRWALLSLPAASVMPFIVFSQRKDHGSLLLRRPLRQQQHFFCLWALATCAF